MTKDELKAMSDREVLQFAIQRHGTNALNDARLRFRHHCATLEQTWEQSRQPSTAKVLRLEFEAVIDILAVGKNNL